MRNSKRWMTAVLTAAMVVSQVIPVFASNASIAGDGTSSGTANILAYSVDKIVVPTTLKVALNPNGYSLVKAYKEAGVGSAAVTKRTNRTAIFKRTYDLKNAEWVYEQVLKEGTAVPGKTVIMDDDALTASTDTYYEYDFVNSQIISLNYGIANKSTNDKVVQVDIHVTQDTNDKAGKMPIEFVDSSTKATYDSTGTVENAAGQDEMKMYLAVVAAKAAAPTTDTFERVTEWADDLADVSLYTKDESGVYAYITADTGDGEVTVGNGTTKPAGSVADKPNFLKALGTGENRTKLYKMSSVIGPEITAKQLSDVRMTVADQENEVAFTPGKENKANASIGFKLPQAEYGPDDGKDIFAFKATQETFGNSLQLNALTGVAGFTITGAMNKKVDWTRADTVALKIQPTYKVSDATGKETYIDEDADTKITPADLEAGTDYANTTDPYNQVVLEGDSAGYTSAKELSSSANSVKLTLPDGVTVSKVELFKVDSPDSGISLASGNHYNVSGTTYTFVASNLSGWTGGKIVFTYSDGKTDTLTIK